MEVRCGSIWECRKKYGIVLKGKLYRIIFSTITLKDVMTKKELHLTFFNFYLPKKSGVCYTITGIYAKVKQNERRYVKGY